MRSTVVRGRSLEEAALFGSDRRGRLLAAAAQVFAEKGYRATSMNDLAEAVGISKLTLYHYVSSKQQLLVELYEAVHQRQPVRQVDRAGHLGLSPAESLRKVLVERIVYICRHVRLVQIFIEEESELPPAMTETVRKLRTNARTRSSAWSSGGGRRVVRAGRGPRVAGAGDYRRPDLYLQVVRARRPEDPGWRWPRSSAPTWSPG